MQPTDQAQPWTFVDHCLPSGPTDEMRWTIKPVKPCACATLVLVSGCLLVERHHNCIIATHPLLAV